MQPARPLVEVAQPRGQPRHAARIREGLRRLLHRLRQRAFEGDEVLTPAIVARQVEQVLFRRFQLLARIQFRLRAEGAVHHRLTHIDQLAAQPGVVDDAAIFAGIDDADHRRQKLAQIGGAAHLIQQAVMLELDAQRHRIGQLSCLDPALDGGEDAAVDGIDEMLGREEFADPFIGLVVGQQRAEQRLLGFEIGGR